MQESEFSPEELVFLQSQGIRTSSVLDARGVKKADYGWVAKDHGCDFVYHNPCTYGHRLKTRAGHCIQCDTSKIAFQKRHGAPGYVYFAYSDTEGLCKVGQATDSFDRVDDLCKHSYAGASDWVLISHYFAEESGAEEFKVHSLLSPFMERRNYQKGGRQQLSREVFRCDKDVGLAIFDAVSQCEATKEAAAQRVEIAWLIDNPEERESVLSEIYASRATMLAEHEKTIADNIAYQHWLNDLLDD